MIRRSPPGKDLFRAGPAAPRPLHHHRIHLWFWPPFDRASRRPL